MHALCSSAVVSGKVATALLVTAATPMSFCILNSPAELDKVKRSNPVHALCSSAVVSRKVATALLVTAPTPMSFCILYSPAELGKVSI